MGFNLSHSTLDCIGKTRAEKKYLGAMNMQKAKLAKGRNNKTDGKINLVKSGNSRTRRASRLSSVIDNQQWAMH